MARPSTVLHLIDTGGPGGAETILLNVVSGLDSGRWCSVPVVPIKDWLWGALQQAGAEPVLLDSQGSFDVQYLRSLRRLMRDTGAEIIHTHLFTSAVYASLAAAFTKVPVVCTFHGQTDIRQNESHRRVKLAIAGRERNRYVFVSDRLRDWFVRNHDIPATRARVVHNGIDCGIFQPAPDEDMRTTLGAQPDDVLVGAVGNMRRPKDYPTFLRAAAQLARQSDRFRFVIVGAADEPVLSELVQLRTELELENRLVFAGFRSDIERVMNALDVYALTSSTEGFSLTTVQAMACATPVVATRCGGPEEILDDGETGLLVPVGNAEQIAAAISELAMNAEKRATMGAAGRRCAVSEFSLASMVEGYAQIYDECLGIPLRNRRRGGAPALAAT
jgi:glycosyltransferase involved in cell wall biosynthesis